MQKNMIFEDKSVQTKSVTIRFKDGDVKVFPKVVEFTPSRYFITLISVDDNQMISSNSFEKIKVERASYVNNVNRRSGEVNLNPKHTRIKNVKKNTTEGE